jgi:hypothetical protein
MSVVIGVDPGLGGALARYDGDDMTIQDMPSWQMMVGRKTRRRIDAVELMDYFELQKVMGAELVIIEAVGARPHQGGMFVFGYTVGLVYMACVAIKLPIETVPPQVWKRMLNVRGKESGDKNAIMHRADELMPDHRGLWRGPNGGKLLDRAEAAMLAYYGLKHALHGITQVNIRDPEWWLAYKRAQTGA